MTHEEYIQSIIEHNGKIVDATALAEYHYKLKKEVIDELKNKMPHTIVITPDLYQQIGTNNRVNIFGFTTFPENSDQTYYLLYDNKKEKIEPSQIDKNFNIKIEKNFKENCNIQISLEDSQGNLIGISNIGKVEVFYAVRKGIWNVNATPEEAIQNSSAGSAELTYLNTYNFSKKSGAVNPCTFWLFIPTYFEVPSTISGSNFTVFQKQSSPVTYQEKTYWTFKLNTTVDNSINSQNITLF